MPHKRGRTEAHEAKRKLINQELHMRGFSFKTSKVPLIPNNPQGHQQGGSPRNPPPRRTYSHLPCI